jgi:hypothetical protein
MPAPPGGEGAEEEEGDPCRVRIPEVLPRTARCCRWHSHHWLQWRQRIDPFPGRVAMREEDLAPGSTHTKVLIPISGCVEQ